MDNTKKFADVAQYIVISMGEEQFGIDIRYIDNIVKMQHITRVPNVASYFKGVINLRGEVLPVMSLRLKMGLEEDVTTKNTRIIILRLEQHGMIGVIVDEVKEVINLADEDIEKFSDKFIPIEKYNIQFQTIPSLKKGVELLKQNSQKAKFRDNRCLLINSLFTTCAIEVTAWLELELC